MIHATHDILLPTMIVIGSSVFTVLGPRLIALLLKEIKNAVKAEEPDE